MYSFIKFFKIILKNSKKNLKNESIVILIPLAVHETLVYKNCQLNKNCIQLYFAFMFFLFMLRLN